MNEYFLESLKFDGIRSAFIGRENNVRVDEDREATLNRLRPYHEREIEKLGFSLSQTWWAEQVHGKELGIVDKKQGEIVAGVDALISNIKGTVLAIYVADCGVIYLVDPINHAIGLVHSGKKGTKAGIVRVAMQKMKEQYGTDASDLVAVLGPCIRPPAYEIDFARMISESIRQAGVRKFYDCGICTSSDLGKYYSYRIEKGSTGRMLALLGIEG